MRNFQSTRAPSDLAGMRSDSVLCTPFFPNRLGIREPRDSKSSTPLKLRPLQQQHRSAQTRPLVEPLHASFGNVRISTHTAPTVLFAAVLQLICFSLSASIVPLHTVGALQPFLIRANDTHLQSLSAWNQLPPTLLRRSSIAVRPLLLSFRTGSAYHGFRRC